LEIEVLEKNDTSMRLLIQEVSVPFMNAIRRIMLSEVPCMAIDEVVIIENSSMLHDEILAHRLGFIPLKTDLDSYNLPEECPCKSEFGCNLCRVALTLETEAGENTKTVHSEALQSENPDITPVSDKVTLAKLAPNQKIQLEAYARLGKGKNHAKWQPVSACAYKYLPQIKINREKCDVCGKCVDVCPKGILINAEKRIETHRILECTLCQDCMDVCPQDPPAVQVLGEKNAFIFNIESTGALPVERIVLEALNILEKKCEGFLNQLR
jgi:DNA-directed RNA polymerase subunit D